MRHVAEFFLNLKPRRNNKIVPYIKKFPALVYLLFSKYHGRWICFNVAITYVIFSSIWITVTWYRIIKNIGQLRWMNMIGWYENLLRFISHDICGIRKRRSHVIRIYGAHICNLRYMHQTRAYTILSLLGTPECVKWR